MTLCGRPKTSNEFSDFNEDIVRGDLEYCLEEKNAALTNVAVYGVSCDAYFTRTLSWKFLNDKAIHAAITDTNNNFKNFRCQLIGGYGCTIIGIYIIDSHLLIIAFVPFN